MVRSDTAVGTPDYISPEVSFFFSLTITFQTSGHENELRLDHDINVPVSEKK